MVKFSWKITKFQIQFQMATSSGVEPELLRLSMSAPLANRSRAIFNTPKKKTTWITFISNLFSRKAVSPCAEAKCRAVLFSSSLILTSAPWSTRSLANSDWPEMEQNFVYDVQFSRFYFEVQLSRLMISKLPNQAHECSVLHPKLAWLFRSAPLTIKSFAVPKCPINE